MRGGGSYYQPIPYVSRGGATRKRLRGGFYPSIMAGVLSNGPILFTPALASGFRLLRNNDERMRSRNRRNKNRKTQGRRSKRTLNRRKNTHKA